MCKLFEQPQNFTKMHTRLKGGYKRHSKNNFERQSND